MPTDLPSLISDLAAEQQALREVLSTLGPAQWEVATHAPGWAVRDQVAHLAFFDEAAGRAIRDPDRFVRDAEAQRTGPRGSGEPAYLVDARALTPAALLDAWEAARSGLLAAARTMALQDSARRLPWYGPPMSAASFLTARLMETWSHGLDVVDVVGVARPPTNRLRHVATLGVLTRGFSYANRGLDTDRTPVFVELVAPSGEVWAFGDVTAPASVKGLAEDFCQVVTQRRHVADTALELNGDAAVEWMQVAQAFAGPPGQGRKPGQFAPQGEH